MLFRVKEFRSSGGYVFRLVPKVVTLNAFKPHNIRCFVLSVAFGANYVTLTEDKPTMSAKKCSREILVSCNMIGDLRRRLFKIIIRDN